MTDGVKYKPTVHDYDRTMEQQAYLLAMAAQKIWDDWSAQIDPQKQRSEKEKASDAKMRILYIALKEMDIFMSGHHAPRVEESL